MAVGMPKPSLKFLALPILFVIFMFVTLQMFSESIGVSNFKFSRAEEVSMSWANGKAEESLFRMFSEQLKQLRNGSTLEGRYVVRIERGGSESDNHKSTTNVPIFDDGDENEQGKEYASRRNTMLTGCVKTKSSQILKNTNVNILEHFRVSWKHRLVYCGVEKVGSTTWFRLFREMANVEGLKNPPNDRVKPELLRTFSNGKNIEFDMFHWALKNFTKFTFVRNPYPRLLSGYVDKFLTPNFVFQNFGKKAIEKFRFKASQKEKECGYGISFVEFIRMVNLAAVTGEARNAHFVPHYDHCRHCEFQYDIVGKMETFEADTKYIMESNKIESLLPKGNFVNETEIADIIDMVGWLYNFKDQAIVNKCVSFTEIKQRYWLKFQVKGLILHTIKIPQNALHNDSITQDDFVKVALDARLRSGDRTVRMANRGVALRQAFQTVPREDLAKFRDIFRSDFEMFGYDIDAPEIFKDPWRQEEGDFFTVPDV